MGYWINTVSFGTVADVSDELVASIFKAEVAEDIAQNLKIQSVELTWNVGVYIFTSR